jgi:hypothetical protein
LRLDFTKIAAARQPVVAATKVDPPTPRVDLGRSPGFAQRSTSRLALGVGRKGGKILCTLSVVPVVVLLGREHK